MKSSTEPNTKPDMEKIMRVLISLLEEQEHVKIEYTLEKKKTA